MSDDYRATGFRIERQRDDGEWETLAEGGDPPDIRIDEGEDLHESTFYEGEWEVTIPLEPSEQNLAKLDALFPEAGLARAGGVRVLREGDLEPFGLRLRRLEDDDDG